MTCTPQIRPAKYEFQCAQQAPRRVGIATIEGGLYAGQHRAVVLTVKPFMRPSPDALDRDPFTFVGIVCRQPEIVALSF
jgi:hypothetical protein